MRKDMTDMRRDMSNLSMEQRGRTNIGGHVATQRGYVSYNPHVPYETPVQSTHHFYNGGGHTTPRGQRHGGLGGRGYQRPHEEFRGGEAWYEDNFGVKKDGYPNGEDGKLQAPITRARARRIKEKHDQIAQGLIMAIEETMKEGLKLKNEGLEDDGNLPKFLMVQCLNLEQLIEQIIRERIQEEARTEPTIGFQSIMDLCTEDLPCADGMARGMMTLIEESMKEGLKFKIKDFEDGYNFPVAHDSHFKQGLTNGAR
ncbi:hypothetical protein M9H77_23143 [Catharanthus roseus]|uniref:Uncharacterized protein n=1 Tax=Catharanthus roseus TaxID=4058 RepID=A0ACC0ASF6_CATRO|nr:hypothetical protein M9H77_23143 [Catharanthus roseus]